MSLLPSFRQSIRITTIFLGTIAGMLPANELQAEETMWAVNDSLDLIYTIDVDTGETSIVGPANFGAGITGPASLTSRPNGDLYGDNDSPELADGVLRIFMPSGLGNILGELTHTPVGSLAFDRNGVLYTQFPESAGVDAGKLGIVHQELGTVTTLEGELLPQLHGLDFNANDGFLYGITGSNTGDASLVKISIAGDLVSTTSLSQNIGDLPGALAFDSSGRLIASNLLGQLFDIAPATGVVSNFRAVEGGASFAPQGLARVVDAAEAAKVFHWRPYTETGQGGDDTCCNTFDYFDNESWETTSTAASPGIGDVAILDASQFSILGPGPWETHVRINATVSELRIATPDDRLIIDDGRTFTIAGGPVSNNGQIEMNSVNSYTFLRIDGQVTLTGNGSLNMAGLEYDQIGGLQGDGSSILTNDVNHTIEGDGALGTFSEPLGIVNHGVIDGNDVDGGALTIDPDATTGLINDGTLTASNGGRLRLQGGSFNSAGGGLIHAAEDSFVELGTGGRIFGGTITTEGTGRVVIPDGLAPILAGVVTNNGQIEMNSFNAYTFLRIDGQATLTGNGSLNMAGIEYDQIQPLHGSADRLTNDVDHTITGDGQIAVNIRNNGLLRGESPESRLTVSGRLSGTGTVGNVTITGTHAPGDSTAIVPLVESYTIASSGRLEIEIGGLVPGNEHDQLVSSGSIDVGGNLQIVVVNYEEACYVPSVGERFTILVADGGVNGTFSNTNSLSSVASGMVIDWMIEYGDNDVVVTAMNLSMQIEPADFDNDGTVDRADLAALAKAYGIVGSRPGDFNCDHTVSLEDLAQFQSALGDVPAPSPTQTVPEPNTATLLILLGAALGLRQRRMRFGVLRMESSEFGSSN